MKKTILSLITFLGLSIVLAGCAVGTKEFSKNGITITVSDDFVQKDIDSEINWSLYLETKNLIFFGRGETKMTLPGYNLMAYTEDVVLKTSKPDDVEIETFDEDGVSFLYAYYLSSDEKYGYMLITKEGSTKFYTMNFSCVKSSLEGNKQKFLDWAKTIVVE